MWWKPFHKLQGMYYLQRAAKNKAYPPLGVKQYIPCAQVKCTLQTQPEITYAQITKQNSYTPINIEQEPHTNQCRHQTSDMQDLKNMMKSLFE
jgi:hypothetical protein